MKKFNIKITEIGCAGHFAASKHCQWKRHTQIGNSYRVSSVGIYTPPNENEMQTLGASKDSFFETMVFKTTSKQNPDNDGCGCHFVSSWTEIDGKRYSTAGKAQKGHKQFVKEYARRARK